MCIIGRHVLLSSSYLSRPKLRGINIVTRWRITTLYDSGNTTGDLEAVTAVKHDFTKFSRRAMRKKLSNSMLSIDIRKGF